MQPKDFLIYYSAIFLVAVVLIMRRKPRRGMLLRLKAMGRSRQLEEPKNQERPLNVVFNYNGHSWDAFEVLGLPAGSAAESVEKAYRDSLARVDAGSKPFMDAAYHAIQSQGKSYKVSNDS